MTFNSKILESAVTPEARARALSQYLDDVSNSYASLINLVDEAISDDSIESYVSVDEQGNVSANIPAIHTWISNHGFRPSTLVALRDGYTQLDTLVISAIASTDDNGEMVSIHLNPGDGSSVFMAMSEAFQDMQATLHAVVCMSAASAAALLDNVANRLTVFRDKIANVFSSAHSTASTTAEYYSGILNDASASTLDIVNRVTEDLQADMLSDAAEADNNAAPGNTDLYQYIGASPIGALDFSSAVNAVVSSVKVVTKAVVAIVKGVVNLVKKAFKWIKRKVTQVTTNPVDIYTISTADGTYPSLDGWEYQFASIGGYEVDSLPFPDSLDEELISSINSKYAGKWLAYRFFFGEVLFQFKSIFWTNRYNMEDPIVKFKPYVLDVDNAATVLSDAGNVIGFDLSGTGGLSIARGSTAADIASSFQSLQDSDLYLTIKDNESKAAKGLALAWNFLYLTLMAAYYESVGSETLLSGVQVAPLKWTGTWTNADFVNLAAGWNRDPGNPQFSVSNILAVTSSATPLTDATLRMLIYNVLMSQAYDRYLNPTGYTFLPYESNVSGFFPGKYAIKTDSQNRKAFNNFMVTLVVVVAVAIIAITTTVLIRRRRAKNFWKRQEFVSKMDSKMWSGEKLTAAEKRRYRRFSRRLNASNYLTGGLNDSGAPDNLVSTSDSNNGISTVIGLIAGHD